MTPSRIAVFWSHVTKTDGCWNWTGRPDHEGYGRFRCDGIQRRTHRIAWTLAGGPRRGLYVLHRCDNRMCVRIEHLFLGTHLDNVADMIAKGRNVDPPLHHGENHHSAKLDPQKVADIRTRAALGEPAAALAREYGVSKSTTWSIVHGYTWR